MSVSGEFEPFVGEALILHRHVQGCQELSSLYRNAGLPFRNERGDDPLGSSKRVENFRTLNDLADGKAVPGSAAAEFISEFVPSLMPQTDKTTKRLVPLGAMKRLKAEEIPGEMNLYDLQNSKLLTSEGAEVIRMRYYNVFDHSEDFQYYQRVLENGHKLSGHMVDGKLQIPVITTMHGSKGRQAKKVVVFSEMSTKCREDKDSEHRLAFVAMTRTEGILEICAEQTVEWAKDYYDYPIKTPKKSEPNG
jgi:superfamily I DNA/RNA helicase